MNTASRPFFASLALVLALSAPLASGCGDDGGGAGGAGSTADVVFEADATDEALDAMLAAADVDDPTQAARLVQPAAGATLDAATPAAFSWTVGLEARVAPPRAPGLQGLPSPSAWAELAALLGPVREAHAHGTPVNGRGYLLVVVDAEGATVHRVFSLAFEHTPSAEAWAQLAAAPQPLRASVRSAIFENDRVASDGGPWQGPAIELTIAP